MTPTSDPARTLTIDEAVAQALEIVRARQRYGDISEIARRAGVTRQTIWNRVQKVLKAETPPGPCGPNGASTVLSHDTDATLPDGEAPA